MSKVAKALSGRELAMARRKALSSSGKAALQIAGNNISRQATGKAGGTKQAPTSASAPPPPQATAGRGGAPASSARAASLARRKALSTRGKTAEASRDRTRADAYKRDAGVEGGTAPSAPPVTKDEKTETRACGCGCKGKEDERTSSEPGRRAPRPSVRRRAVVPGNSGKTLALARRKALSSRGKAALADNVSEAQAVRAGNPKISGRELARAVREKRSRQGNAGQKKSAPCGRQRKTKNQTESAGAQDAPWKVGASETVSGQIVTGTMVGRKPNVTGDEPSTCRVVTGTEYLGADIFREFCQTDSVPPASPRKVNVTTTSHGNRVTGNRLGRGNNVTGNEPGTCKRVTGDEYVSAEQVHGYCGELTQKSPRKVSMAETMKGKTVTGDNVGRSDKVTGDERGMNRQLTGTQYTQPEQIGKAPVKVEISSTLRGGSVTGTLVGRRERVTGNEIGSCHHITGDDYEGKEHYSDFCDTVPQPQDKKVAESRTLGGVEVTGSIADRADAVTGNEPGTCKAITGTPYSGGEQYSHYCSPEQQQMAAERMRPMASVWGKPVTGQQPSVDHGMTGAEKGACEPVSGTPYVGADQVTEVCPAVASQPGSPDFPQPIGADAPWQDFSVRPPAHAAHKEANPAGVTGSQYENGDIITGPFGKAAGKVTGTEEARFDRHRTVEETDISATAERLHGRVRSRISGEGMDAGIRITGDDWNRGDRVTGTEGPSARRRNPTLRNERPSTVDALKTRRAEDTPAPVSLVTGGSGNTEKGALVTYSGGARG